ncbi:hypothetical protein D3P08_14735 [Paenibacillus nanensis]|uniref:NUDIX domain-containing protein n=1 Tax=Paenibacillus nanensis TaxID=393251 RepID=A0A3A1UW81_9BACL|nr:hypothetical protein [Paenibacillus nanensis]RIX51681.1 hypothetical protein D3P08_14735 [Paenibacillus nanensis]
MELLREIYERELGISGRDNSSRRHGTSVWLKRIARFVIFNVREEVALLHIADGDYYELPGGELEADAAEEAMLRVMREFGISATAAGGIGLVMEYRDEHELLQFSYGFLAETADETGPEHEDAYQEGALRWLKLKDAIALLQGHGTDSYEGKFSQARDLCFLKQIR